ncbi:MAG: glycosyltransferase [Candidatus Asgardarchaeia archaeon]
MKVVMVNDCAFVGESLIAANGYPDLSFTHIKRSRKFFDKTFGIFWKVLNSEGDVYHTHYLLQDTWLTLKLKRKKPHVAHAHGSDLRYSMRSKVWGNIVRYNLKNSDVVLVAQPMLLDLAREYNENSEYFPIPYHPMFEEVARRGERYKGVASSDDKLRVLMPCSIDFLKKGNDRMFKALVDASKDYDGKVEVSIIDYGPDRQKFRKILGRERSDNLIVKLIGYVPHDSIHELITKNDLIIGAWGKGNLDTVAIESMACGVPVIQHVLVDYYPGCPMKEYHQHEEVVEDIKKMFDRRERVKLVRMQLKYVKENHNPFKLLSRLYKLYVKLV